MIPIFHGRVIGGKAIMDTPERVWEYIKTLDGNRIEVVIRKARSQRSNQQNRYYHGIVLELLSQHTGYTPDEMHEICKYQFLKQGGDGKFEYIKSTTKLNTAEFETYLENIKRWAVDILGLVIPDPNEVAE